MTPNLSALLDESGVRFACYFFALFLGLLGALVVDEWRATRLRHRRRLERRRDQTQRRRIRSEIAVRHAEENLARHDGFVRVDAATRAVCKPGATPAKPEPVLIFSARHGHDIAAWPVNLN